MSGPLVELIPEALDGERVDRVVSLLAGCSRSEAAALVTAGAVTLDGGVVDGGQAARPGRPDALGRRRALPEPALPRARSDHPGRGRPRGRRRRRRRQAGRAGGAPGRRAGRRDPRQRAARPLPGDGRRRRAPPARHRPPPGPGHVRAPGGGPDTGGLPRPRRGAVGPAGHPPVPGPGLGRARGRPRHRRRARSAAHRATPPAWRWWPAARRPAPATRSATAIGSPSCARSSTASWRRAARTRSGSTWPASATPSSATATTGAPATASRSPAWSSTPATWPSPTPSAVSRWRSPRRSRPTWPPVLACLR